MTSQQIADQLTARFGAQIRQALPGDRHPRIHVNAADWRAIAEYLRNDPALHFDWLANLSGVDYVADEMMCVVYDLWSFDLRHEFAVKVYCARENPRMPSVTDLWRAADWNEREAYDMFGIIFDGHPDLRRILTWNGYGSYPLRKDYPLRGIGERENYKIVTRESA
jgi:NADH-quinone oxidoreductase subunit C